VDLRVSLGGRADRAVEFAGVRFRSGAWLYADRAVHG
jgi:hypothetical protein